MNPWDKMLLKNRFSPILVILILSILYSCANIDSKERSISLYKLSGESQGTTYLIQVYDHQINFEAAQIDSLLEAFDQELSTYLPTSLISRFNQKDFTDTLVPLNSRFYSMLDMSDNIYQVSNGIFDPSIKPIMDLWDFDGNNNDIPTKESIDSALQFVSFENQKEKVLNLEAFGRSKKKSKNSQEMFSQFLERKRIQDNQCFTLMSYNF